MQNYSNGLSPGDEDRIRNLSDFWNEYGIFDDPGGTTREVLRKLQQEVTDCLYERPPDISKAESLTAKAQLLMIGWSDQ
ncbi:MAG: hypothetical protein CME32_19945 [Gimesia sp.]|jgi:hypothetical protein|nr:hypothetical protein [Gimesia sp.]